MIIDIHCHYTLTRCPVHVTERFSFEPAPPAAAPAADDPAAGPQPPPTHFESCGSPRAMSRLTYRGLKWLLGVPQRLPPGAALDARLRAFYEQHLFAPGPIERHVLLAFDAYHDHAGRLPPLPVQREDRGSDIYTSNSLVRALCRRHPARFLFGASVHPYRADAPRCVQEVFAGGACLLKWLPLHQNIDIRDPRSEAVLRTCASLGLPLLVHYGAEFTLATQHPEFRSVRPLLDVLRRLRRDAAMPPVIVAHAATPVTPLGEEDSHEQLLAALAGEFADAPLFADISALTTWGKIRYLRRLARRQELHTKLLFGTDFPVPDALLRLWFDLGRRYRSIAADPSWPQRIAHIARQLGYNEIVLHHAAEILPNLDAFQPRSHAATA